MSSREFDDADGSSGGGFFDEGTDYSTDLEEEEQLAGATDDDDGGTTDTTTTSSDTTGSTGTRTGGAGSDFSPTPGTTVSEPEVETETVEPSDSDIDTSGSPGPEFKGPQGQTVDAGEQTVSLEEAQAAELRDTQERIRRDAPQQRTQTGQGVELGNPNQGVSASITAQARQFEQDILEANPGLTAADVGIFYDEATGTLVPEFSDIGERKRRRNQRATADTVDAPINQPKEVSTDDIERRFEERVGVDLDPTTDIDIDRTEREITARLTDVGIEKVRTENPDFFKPAPELRPDPRSDSEKLLDRIDIDFSIPDTQLDLDELIQAGEEKVTDFANTATALSTAVTFENVAAAADPESPGGTEITVEELVAAGEEQEGPLIKAQQGATAGAVGLAGLPLQTAELGLTAVELGKYNVDEALAGRGEESLDQTAEVVAEGVRKEIEKVDRALAEDPVGTSAAIGTSLVGTAALFGGASRLSPRAGRAARYSIQPGEELASEGLTLTFPRIASRFPGGRIDNEEIVLRGIQKGAEGVRRRARQVDAVLSGEGSLSPSPRQARAIERFRPTRPPTAEAELGGAGSGPLLRGEDVDMAMGVTDPIDVRLAEARAAGGGPFQVAFGKAAAEVDLDEATKPEFDPTRSEVLGGGASEVARLEMVERQKAARRSSFGDFEGEFDPVGGEVGRLELGMESEVERELDRVRSGPLEAFATDVGLDVGADLVQQPIVDVGLDVGLDQVQRPEIVERPRPVLETELAELEAESRAEPGFEWEGELEAELARFESEFRSEFAAEFETEPLLLDEPRRRRDDGFGGDIFSRQFEFFVTPTPGVDIDKAISGIQMEVDELSKDL